MERSTAAFAAFPRGCRCLAFSVDLIVLSAGSKLGAYFSGYLMVLVFASRGQLSQLSPSYLEASLRFGSFFWFFIFAYLNFGLLQGLTGSSFGKMLCGLVVINREQATEPLGVITSWLRTLAYLPSLLPLGLGFLLALVGSRKDSLHDRLTGTQVIYREELEQMLAPVAAPLLLTDQNLSVEKEVA